MAKFEISRKITLFSSKVILSKNTSIRSVQISHYTVIQPSQNFCRNSLITDIDFFIILLYYMTSPARIYMGL